MAIPEIAAPTLIFRDVFWALFAGRDLLAGLDEDIAVRQKARATLEHLRAPAPVPSKA